MVYPCNGILLSNGKEVCTNPQINMDNSQKQYTEQNKLDMKNDILDDSIYVKLKKTNFIYSDRKQISGFLGLGMRG